jgi:hypothetical protein
MQADELIARAVTRSGFADRGESWREGLERFLVDFRNSGTLNALGRQAGEAMVLDTLCARFGIDDWIARHPDVLDKPVARPVFITGLPRAGTTLLLNLLALDPQHRVYGNWEANREVPPVEAAHLKDDPRIARKVAEVNAALESGALDHRYHVEMGDEPGECVWLMGQDFKGYPWLILTAAPDYFEWLYGEADMVAAYRHHKRALQVMQSRAPGRWILKFPSHAPFLDALLEVYPDALIVATHRDPLRPLGSSCSASHYLTRQFNDGLNPAHVGRETMRILDESLKGICTLRERHPRTLMHDLHYDRLVADPIGEIRIFYAFIGEVLAPEVEEAMRSHWAEQRALRSRVGAHRYDLADYGLDAARLSPVFDAYREQFGITRET